MFEITKPRTVTYYSRGSGNLERKRIAWMLARYDDDVDVDDDDDG